MTRDLRVKRILFQKGTIIYNLLNILHEIYMYQKLYIHHWWPEFYFRDLSLEFESGYGFESELIT